MVWLRRSYLALVYAFLYLPLLVLVVYSFNDSRSPYGWKGFTLKWYESLFDNAHLLQSAWHSLLLAACAATLTTLIGTLTAIALHRYRFPGKTALHGLLFVLMMVPDIVLAIALLIFFIALSMHLGFWTLLISHTTFCLPFVVVTVYARLVSFDERTIEAARDLGAGEFQVFRTVLVPLLLPAIVAGWLLGFTLSLDDVIISTFATGPTFEVLPLRIYSMVRLGIRPEVNALATLFLLISILALSLSLWYLRKP